MKKITVHKSEYFYGNKISDYGLEHGFVDYSTLAKSFDAVLCNDINKLSFVFIGDDYNEPTLANGYDILYIDNNSGDFVDYDNIDDWDNITEQPRDIFQYYIIDENGFNILHELTDEIVYYIPVLDIYVWGVTHYGTRWNYVLTDIKLELDEV